MAKIITVTALTALISGYLAYAIAAAIIVSVSNQDHPNLKAAVWALILTSAGTGRAAYRWSRRRYRP